MVFWSLDIVIGFVDPSTAREIIKAVGGRIISETAEACDVLLTDTYISMTNKKCLTIKNRNTTNVYRLPYNKFDYAQIMGR